MVAIEAKIDLHGLIVDEARDKLARFLSSSVRHSHKCVLIIHGKGAKAATTKPKIKNMVNGWLRQHPSVLAFCSAIPKHGGTGAVYVLLKRSQIKTCCGNL